jgi:hypothetical protein
MVPVMSRVGQGTANLGSGIPSISIRCEESDSHKARRERARVVDRIALRVELDAADV